MSKTFVSNEAMQIAQRRYDEIEADVRERLKNRAAVLGISVNELLERFKNRSRTDAVTGNQTGSLSYCTKRNLLALAEGIDENHRLRLRAESQGLPVPWPRWPLPATN